ncbi:peptidase M24, structural domain-containing protein [Cyathus striatus]|nr:peptidase M24, structural domain-containing protein [Cyathus striatus]
MFHRTRRALRPFLSTRHSLHHPDDFGAYSVILPEEPFVFGVDHISPRSVPAHIKKPKYADKKLDSTGEYGGPTPEARISLGGEDESGIREAARLARDVREYAGSLVKVGVTTNSIDEAVHEYILSHGAYPSPLMYSGFPRSCCTSVNNVIVHGIPDERPLEGGDIINIGITVYLNGYHGDTSQTFLAGDVDDQGRELVQITTDALNAATSICGPGVAFKTIGKRQPFSVSPYFTGHGIGKLFHTSPWIVHHRNEDPGVMMPGHCFTIEPAIIQGRHPSAWLFPDGWTASTENCARAAQQSTWFL